MTSDPTSAILTPFTKRAPTRDAVAPDNTTAARGPVTFDTSSIGSTGLKQYSGFIAEEFLRELSGMRGMRTYREMADNDPIVGGVLFAFEMLIRNAEWTVTPKDESPEADAGKVFLEEVLADMTTPMSVVMEEVCSMFTYGYAPMEIIWKRRVGPDAPDGTGRSKFTDGKIGVRAIALRAQPTVVRWEIDQSDGTLNGLWQQPYTSAQCFIPIEKMLLFRTTSAKNNPEGRSALRNAYRSWYFKKRIEEIEGIGLERDLAGLPVARIPGHYFSPSASPEDKMIFQAWQSLVMRVRRDQQEGLIIPSDKDSSGNYLFDFELLSTGGSRQFDTSKVIDRYDRRIATSVLADFLFLGQQAVGSFALSSDKTALFAAAIGGFLHSMRDVFNQHFIPRLWKLNGLNHESMPQMVVGDVETPDLTEIGAYISDLSKAGAPLFPDRKLENYLRDAAGFPAAPEDGEDERLLPGETRIDDPDATGQPPKPEDLEE